MADVLAIALRLAPLAHDVVRAVVGTNAVAKLMKLIGDDLRRSHRVPHAERSNVVNAWSRQRVDPELTGCLIAWIATADEEFLARAGSRWRVLLSSDLDSMHLDLDAIVGVAMQSARRRLAEVQVTDRDAIHVDGDYTRNVVRAVSDDVKGHISRELARNTHRGVADSSENVRVRLNLPRVAASFSGREEELDALDKSLRVSNRAVVTQAITGLGGVGKSQLAARYVQQHAADYDVVAWIRAEDGGVTDLAQLAAKLGEPIDGLSPGEAAQLALDWLGESTQRWLVVLDNVQSADQLDRLLPATGSGRILVTSRDRALRQFGPVLTLDVFDDITATRYLIERAERPDDKHGAERLAKALGCLPLALSHAAAYCQSGTSFTDYLELLAELPAPNLFDTHPELSYTKTVASTWKASIKAASSQASLAVDVLQMAAYLGPDAIPKSLFHVLVDANTAIGRKSLADALNALARYSLATLNDTSLSVHRLLQRTVRDDAASREDENPAVNAITALDLTFPHEVRMPATWPQCEQLLPHAFALADTLSQSCNRWSQAINVLNRASEYLIRAETSHRCVATAQISLRYAERVLEAEDGQMLAARESLATAYLMTGAIQEAVAIYEPLVSDHERILGVEHPATLYARNGLAIAYRNADRVGEAITLFEGLLTAREQLLGSEHLATLLSRHNLARAYLQDGRVDEAIRILEPLLADKERILGVEHPDTLSTRSTLAHAYRAARRIDEAIAIYEPLIATRQRVIGAEHHDTLRTRHYLARAYHAAGRTDEAIAIYEPLIADETRILGSEHRDTRDTCHHLSIAYRDAGRTDDANRISLRIRADE